MMGWITTLSDVSPGSIAFGRTSFVPATATVAGRLTIFVGSIALAHAR